MAALDSGLQAPGAVDLKLKAGSIPTRTGQRRRPIGEIGLGTHRDSGDNRAE